MREGRVVQEVVAKLNARIEEFKIHEFFPIDLSYASDGEHELISFCGNVMWSSIDDGRDLSDEGYEHLESFVYGRILQSISILKQVEKRLKEKK